MGSLTTIEANSVTTYIGVHGGYLGDFSYATHAEFYPNFCGLDINPDEYEGTTRQKFIKILSTVLSMQQNKILEGVLLKYPLTYFEEQAKEGIITEHELNGKRELYSKILSWIEILKDGSLSA